MELTYNNYTWADLLLPDYLSVSLVLSFSLSRFYSLAAEITQHMQNGNEANRKH